MSTPISGMAVTVTLVFSDESHREAWLTLQGVIDDGPLPQKNEAGEYLVDEAAPGRGPKRTAILRRLDYERRRANTDLQYTVGPLKGGIPMENRTESTRP